MTFTSRLRATWRLVPLALAMHAAPALARTVAVNQTNIVDSLAAAQPGDKLVLAAGGYGVVVLPRKVWQTSITIDARAASMTGIVMFRVSGVNWIGGTIIGTSYGVSIRDAERINLTGTTISDAVRGIVINNASDVQILRNTLRGMQTDGIDVIGQRILIEGNVISDMRPAPGDHPDGIQLWSANGEQTSDITVRGNTITGRSQGVFARADELGLRNLVVTGNKVTVAYGNGIVLLNSRDSVATGNSVKSTVDRLNRANMRVEGANNIACGNTVPDVPNAIAAQPCAA